MAEKAKEEATPTQQLQKAVKKTENVLKVAPKAAPKAPPPKTPPPKKTPSKKEKVKTPKSGKKGFIGRMFSRKAKVQKTEFDVEVFSLNSTQTMPLTLVVNSENVMLRHFQNKMKETFIYGKQLLKCQIDQKNKNTLNLLVRRSTKDKRELLLRVKDPSELPVIAQMIDEKKAAYIEMNNLAAVATRSGAKPEAPKTKPKDPPPPAKPAEPEPAPEPASAPEPPAPEPEPVAAAPDPPQPETREEPTAPPAPQPPSTSTAAPPPPSPPPTPPPAAPKVPAAPKAPAEPQPKQTAPPPEPSPPSPAPPVPEAAPAAMAKEATAPETPRPPPIPESVMRDLGSSAKASTPSGPPPIPSSLSKLNDIHGMPSLGKELPNMSPLMSSYSGNMNLDLVTQELTKTRSYALRMREALFDRDRRLIALEKRLLEETSLRRMRDTECMEMSGKLKAADEELKVLRQKSRLAHALQLGGPASKELVARHPDVLQRESMRAARVEVIRLEKERDELAFMNGRLILRLNDMQTSVDRIKKALKVEDAASRLNEAYSAADQAQRMVGDTAALLLTEGTLDHNTPSYHDRNPLHLGSHPDPRMVF